MQRRPASFLKFALRDELQIRGDKCGDARIEQRRGLQQIILLPAPLFHYNHMTAKKIRGSFWILWAKFCD
jgi:hypothetical protein